MVFAFADDSPIRPSGRNKKHRRGRGPPTNNNKSSPSSPPGGNSYRQGGHNYSSAATRVSSLTAQSQAQRQGSQGVGGQQQQKSQAYVTSDAWDNPNTINSSKLTLTSAKHHPHQNNNQSDNNSCTGSLTYSASSSVQSAESSNDDSSFSKIMDVIDKEGEGARDVKEFMAKQSKAAVAGGFADACGGGQDQNAAVQGWNQRRQAQQVAQAQKPAPKNKKKKKSLNLSHRKQPPFSMGKQHVPLNSNVDLNYSKSEDDDAFDVDFDENIILETIAGMDDDLARPTSQSDNQNPFRNNNNQPDSFFQTSYTSPNNSAPSSPRRSNSHTTPPPNSRKHRTTSTTTPPGAGLSTPISRSSSRQSKSSSDGSWDTPAPASPPHTHGMMAHHSNSMKPPHARSAPVGSKTRGRSSGSGKDDKVVEDLAEAFYAKSWMCGFADAFNFDGFDKFKE